MKNARQESSTVPDQVIDVLKTSSIGYLSVLSKNRELYSYPVAFHYSGLKIYFVTPVSAAKFKIIKANPAVSFIVDNGKVTTEACGAMIQGKARAYSIGRTLLSILSVAPKIAGFSKKYPGMLAFYARGKELPDERKLYKYRLIRIDPSKIIYWMGYSFGRFVSEKARDSPEDLLVLTPDEDGVGVAAKLLQPPDIGTLGSTQSGGHDWLARLDATVSQGALSEDERRIIGSYWTASGQAPGTRRVGSVTAEERKLLRKAGYSRGSSGD